MSDALSIVDWIFGQTKELDKIVKSMKPGRASYSSISDRASRGILQFPLLASQSLDISTIQMVSKACERNYTSFIEIIISMNPEVMDSDGDIANYLKNFHQNTKHISIRTENYEFQIAPIEGSRSAYANLTEELVPYLSDFVTEALNDKYAPTMRKILKPLIPMKEAKGGGNTFHNNSNHRDTNNMAVGSFNTNTPFNSIGSFNKVTNIVNNPQQSSGNKSDRIQDVIPSNILMDNDVKKANELVPTTLHVRVLRRDADSMGGSKYIDFIIGIKSVIHPIKSEEMIENLVEAGRKRDRIFDFIRWTTGEISFFKDFLFGIKSMKNTINKAVNGGSSWWLTLRRRAEDSNVLKFTPNRLLPNSTIAVSMEEVNFIKANYGFDIMQPAVLHSIMRQYFLLGFIVVDQSTETVHVMFENENAFHTYTFNSLERENSNAAKQFREMLKAVQKI